MRCICCNNEIEWNGYERKKQDGTEEDMCYVCLNIARNPNMLDIRVLPNGTYVYSYALEEQTSIITEMVKHNIKVDESEYGC